MKRFLKVFVPIILAAAIIAGIGWYLFLYDPGFTQDILLSGARYFADNGNMDTASWFYDLAYDQKQDFGDVAIEVAEKYISQGNYTQAEVALNKAIKDGGGAEVYITLCKTYVAQDKLLDAVKLLDKISDPAIKETLDALRPKAPTTPQKPDFYNQYISVTVESNGNTIYVNRQGEYPSVLTDRYNAPITLVDGENILYALAVSESGLVSPLSIFGYTIGGIIEEVVFMDAAIEQSVRSILQVSEDKIVYSNDLWDIKEFTVPANAKNYSDIQYMINLEQLTIEDGVADQLQHLKDVKNLKALTIKNVTLTSEDMDVISGMTTLETLTLDGCGLSTAAPLSELTALTYLSLNNNAIRNITALSSMPALKQLYMQRNALQDLSSLSSCTAIEKMDISYNSITSISALSNLTNVTYLDISHNQISDLSSVGQMKELAELRANHNAISDIASLSACQKLTYTDISNNSITSLEPLGSHVNITYLNFSHNQVTALPAWSVSSKFVTIDGSYNQISDLTPLAGHHNINNILMDYNTNIESVEMLANCHVLIQVNVYGTKVTEVDMLTDQSIIVNYNPIETAE